VSELRQERFDLADLRRRRLRQLEPREGAIVRCQAIVATRTGEDSDPRTCNRLRNRGDFHHLQELRHRVRADHAESVEQCLIVFVLPGQGAGMAGRHRRAQLGPARAADDNGDCLRSGAQAGLREGRNIADSFHEESETGDVGIIDKVVDVIFEAENGLVPRTDEVRERHRPVIRDDVTGYVATLCDDGGPALTPQFGIERRPDAAVIDVVHQTNWVRQRPCRRRP